MSIKPVAIVLGAGARTGKPIADRFLREGYRVAAVSRSINEGQDGDLLNLKGDLSKPETVPAIFQKVKDTFGAPTVVAYNASITSPPSSADDWFSHDINKLADEYATNTLSVFAAAREAVAGWKTIPVTAASPGVFIYTGNFLNENPMAPSTFVSLGTGKSASAYLIGAMAQQFKDEPYRFYFADQRKADGAAVYGEIDGPAHAEFYLQLAKGEGKVPWQATFVSGKGYESFKEKR